MSGGTVRGGCCVVERDEELSNVERKTQREIEGIELNHHHHDSAAAAAAADDVEGMQQQ